MTNDVVKYPVRKSENTRSVLGVADSALNGLLEQLKDARFDDLSADVRSVRTQLFQLARELYSHEYEATRRA